MQARTKQGLQTVRRVQNFLEGRDIALAMGAMSAHADALGQALERLEQHATDQEALAREARAATDIKRELRQALRREYLRPIALTAAYLFADEPGLRAGFRLAKELDDEGLLQVAYGFAERADVHRASFVAKGLAPDFVERIRRAADEFRSSGVQRALVLGRRTAATQGLLAEVRKARQLVRLIDAMLSPRLASRPELLAEWKSVSRFARRRSASVTAEVAGSVADAADGPELALVARAEVQRAA